MIREQGGRAVLTCDHHSGCGMRTDLGPYLQWLQGVHKLPTGWLDLGNDRHQCLLHALPL